MESAQLFFAENWSWRCHIETGPDINRQKGVDVMLVDDECVRKKRSLFSCHMNFQGRKDSV